MNSEFMTAQSEAFAKRLQAKYETQDAQVDGGWRVAFGRAPTAEEKSKALAFLSKSSLPRLCLLWFNMSEYLYVD